MHYKDPQLFQSIPSQKLDQQLQSENISLSITMGQSSSKHNYDQPMYSAPGPQFGQGYSSDPKNEQYAQQQYLQQQQLMQQQQYLEQQKKKKKKKKSRMNGVVAAACAAA